MAGIMGILLKVEELLLKMGSIGQILQMVRLLQNCSMFKYIVFNSCADEAGFMGNGNGHQNGESSRPTFPQYCALADYSALTSRELGLTQGEVVELVKIGCAGWWYVRRAQHPWTEGWWVLLLLSLFTLLTISSCSGHRILTWSASLAAIGPWTGWGDRTGGGGAGGGGGGGGGGRKGRGRGLGRRKSGGATSRAGGATSRGREGGTLVR